MLYFLVERSANVYTSRNRIHLNNIYPGHIVRVNCHESGLRETPLTALGIASHEVRFPYRRRVGSHRKQIHCKHRQARGSEPLPSAKTPRDCRVSVLFLVFVHVRSFIQYRDRSFPRSTRAFYAAARNSNSNERQERDAVKRERGIEGERELLARKKERDSHEARSRVLEPQVFRVLRNTVTSRL